MWPKYSKYGENIAQSLNQWETMMDNISAKEMLVMK